MTLRAILIAAFILNYNDVIYSRIEAKDFGRSRRMSHINPTTLLGYIDECVVKIACRNHKRGDRT